MDDYSDEQTAHELAMGVLNADDTPRIRLLSAKEVKQRPRPPYLVEGVLPRGALFQVFGQTGEYKSFVLLDLLASIANDNITEFMGHPVRRHGLAVFILGEGGDDAGMRIEAWEYGHPGSTNDWLKYSVEDGLDLMDPKCVQGIINDLIEYRDANFPGVEYEIVVFDTQADHMPNGDEDKSRDFSRVKRAMQQIKSALDGCAVGLVHHTGWDPKRERGSSRQRQALDVVMQIEDHTITNVKQKIAAKFDDLHFEMVKVEPAGSLYARMIEPPSNMEKLAKAASETEKNTRTMLGLLAAEDNGRLSVNKLKQKLGVGHDKWCLVRDLASHPDRGWITYSSKGVQITAAGRDELARPRD